MRVFVEAAERFAREVGLFSMRRYSRPRFSTEYDALLVAPDCDAPAMRFPASNGTISIADALAILKVKATR